MTLKEAEVLALATLKQVMEEKVTLVCQCCPTERLLGLSNLLTACLTLHHALPRLAACAMLQVTDTNVDIASVAPAYHLYSQDEIQDVISRL